MRSRDWRSDVGSSDHDLEGTTSNRSAIGARVIVRWSGRQQVQEVSGGSGFSGQNQSWLHYGLGAATAVDSVTIAWPSGPVDILEPPESSEERLEGTELVMTCRSRWIQYH